MKSPVAALLTASAALLSLCAVTAADAAPITLYDTGVSANGTLLAGGTIGDPHYSLISVPGSSSAVRVISAATGWPVQPGVWIGDNATSRWIGPNNDGQLNGPAGSYIYRTSFDLAGFDAATAHINGLWSTDDNGLDILINGHSLGYTTPGGQFAAGFKAFEVASGFQAGINTLDFVINNGGGPTGLRVEMTGSAAEIPEPTTAALVGVALAGIALSRRARN